jgi:hypothetical protein
MLDDHPEDAEQIEADILAAARELLARPAPRRWIKLMAGLGQSPLTQSTGPGDIEVDPGTLRISDGLRSGIARWNAYFEAVLSGWPAAGGSESEHDAEQFAAAGRQLVSQLQDELDASYHAEYVPVPIRPPGVKLRRRPNLLASSRPLIGMT